MKNYKRNTTQKIVMASLFAALVCVATMIVKIPSPLKGYFNLGDCIVLVCGWILSPVYGFLAAGIGSALADLFSGYAMYIPATFLIKGTMSLVACYGLRLMSKKIGKFPARLIGGISAEILMAVGYFVFEGVIYGFASSVINIPANVIQGVAGIVFGAVIIKIFDNSKILF